ncbi:hypothetical protein GF336_06835 [Candidatus Woesearchaeota archaeon]|nr:hypothetical protein [Candidatus Woesearchaeota archaeon]
MPTKGTSLEKKVEKQFRRLGYSTERNHYIYDKNNSKSEIDVYAKKYLGLKRRYIECKDYHENIPLKELAKFKEVLSQNKISRRKAFFIYHGKLTERCKYTGIRLMDYKTLKKKISRIVWGKRALFAGAITAAYYHKELYDYGLQIFEKIQDIF